MVLIDAHPRPEPAMPSTRPLLSPRLGWALAWMVSVALLGAPAWAEAPSPAAAWAALPTDPPPAAINNDTHYLVSNEDRLDLFWRRARGRGGLQIGVGTDQNYLLAGWSRPEVLVLLDFDQAVVDLHAVYRALFLEAPDPETFRALWSDPKGAAQAIERHGDAQAQVAVTLSAYARAHEAVAKRLAALQRDLERRRVPGFLSDAEAYAHLRRLYAEGRVARVRGDLTGPQTVKAIGALARRSGLTVGVLYLSNAEQYFMYGQAFRDNMRGLPLEDSSVVLRTLPARPRDFEYIIQRGHHFHAWLDRRRTTSVYVMRGFKRGQHLVDGDVHLIGAPR